MSKSNNHNIATKEPIKFENASYEVLSKRLETQRKELYNRINALDKARKEAFGSIDTTLINTTHVNTEHNCIPHDMISIGDRLIFGYNVYLGLKAEASLNDVFSIYRYDDGSKFAAEGLEFINDPTFIDDFKKLYKYYKHTHFLKFFTRKNHLFMVFSISKDHQDVKTFKWLMKGDKLLYVDNRSDHEYQFPAQHEFTWKKTNRDLHRAGKHPHVSIEDILFVETIGGDLTIKVEDNTDDGLGIYAEPVDNKEQRLEDAEIYYAMLGNIVILKIRPYQENEFRYIVYNSKLKKAQRVDAIKDACVKLPNDYGIIFSNGYYLQTGEYKLFESKLNHMLFERRIDSQNGEDYLYVFYNIKSGIYLLLSYNLIRQRVENPIVCRGYSIFENGHLINFRGEETAKKHHAIQIWQSSYTDPNFMMPTRNDSYLSKIGNKEIVKAMAACHELIGIIEKGHAYEDIYRELVTQSTDIIDSFHWLAEESAMNIKEPLLKIAEVANTTIGEYEKVLQIKSDTLNSIAQTFSKASEVISSAKRNKPISIGEYVTLLMRLKEIKSELSGLKELRYADMEAIDEIVESTDQLIENHSQASIKFLTNEDALVPYKTKIRDLEKNLSAENDLKNIEELHGDARNLAMELEMLIEIVNGLNIKDVASGTTIIEHISSLYAEFNKSKASLDNRRKALLNAANKASVNAQIKLLDQTLIHYIDLCDTPEKCEEYLSKLMIQLEEMEGKYAEFQDYQALINDQREKIYDIFESKKIRLIEAKNNKAIALMETAERILKAIKNRLGRFIKMDQVHAYFATDPMINKAKETISRLSALGDVVKADDLQGKFNLLKEEALRQIKDKQELYVDGHNIIKFGKHQFSVNTQPLELTVIFKNDALYFHLTGTDFFEKINDTAMLDCKSVWDQAIVSENQFVYRAEYLAYQIFTASINMNRDSHGPIPGIIALSTMNDQEKLSQIQQFMSTCFDQSYVKGVHDQDALIILNSLIHIHMNAGMLRFSPDQRACGLLCWHIFLNEEDKSLLNHQLKGAGMLLKVFPESNDFESLKKQLMTQLEMFLESFPLFNKEIISHTADYLFLQLSQGDDFVIDPRTAELHKGFYKYLSIKKFKKTFENSIANIDSQPKRKFQLIRQWLSAFVHSEKLFSLLDYINITAATITTQTFENKNILDVSLESNLKDMSGAHEVIQDGGYQLKYISFMDKLYNFQQSTVPLFNRFNKIKKRLTREYAEKLNLKSYQANVLSSFVRNQLIDQFYLPLIGDNLAKQIGAVGEEKRTDLMGLLLLISPPGYGKTTLMEYVAQRLGLIFMKINGPSIGSKITSVDPAEATNAGAREELEKLNLSFEMGDNVMIYLDDIQHCNPEFLQKFISLCDGQRKIEGVYKGRSKTYDFRGKKVCVVMAGNPYTEQGEKFRIPDMLANRADIYNLGDIIGDNASAFKLSYLENCMTSNPVLKKIASKSYNDFIKLVKMAESGQKDHLSFETGHTEVEIEEYMQVIQKLLVIREVILKVNNAYIKSAAQAEEYRIEPAFKLQGSYRDMNKIASKVLPLVNAEELQQLIDVHYENEAQILNTGTEINLIKFRILSGTQTKAEKLRWNMILETFMKNQKLNGFGGNDPTGKVLVQMENINDSIKGIIKAISKNEKDEKVR